MSSKIVKVAERQQLRLCAFLGFCSVLVEDSVLMEHNAASKGQMYLEVLNEHTLLTSSFEMSSMGTSYRFPRWSSVLTL